MAERTVKVGPFSPGLNNRLEPTELDVRLQDRSTARHLYGADNIDLTKNGFKRRRGFEKKLSANVHSLWSDGDKAFAVINDELRAIARAGTALMYSPLRAGMAKLPVSYVRAPNDIVYWSNGAELRCVIDGADYPISPAPALAPSVYATTGGALPPGQYLVAFTWLGPQGESAPSFVQTIDVPAGGRLVFADTAGATVWVSDPNGDFVSSQGVVDELSVLSAGGRISRTLNTAAMPPGQIVRIHKGSLLVARDNLLIASVPYRHGVYDPARAYVPFPARITVVEPVLNGVFVCADKTYWLGSVFGDASLQEKLPFGGLFGSGVYSADEEKAYWQSPQGLVAGDSSGNVMLLQDDVLTFGDASAGATAFHVRDGRNSVITSRTGVQPNRAGALAWADAEVIRKETSDEI